MHAVRNCLKKDCVCQPIVAAKPAKPDQSVTHFGKDMLPENCVQVPEIAAR
jgi:hypothetical protein